MNQLHTMSELSETELTQTFEDEYDKKIYEDFSQETKSAYYNSEMTMKTGLHEDSTSRVSLSPRIKEILYNELRAPPTLLNCPDHREEEPQFYCFDTNKLLCAECVVSGKHTRHQVVNFKKAETVILQEMNDLLAKMENKAQMYGIWSQQSESRKEQLFEIFSDYKQQMILSMDELRRKIDLVQEKLLEEADHLCQEKLNEIEVAKKNSINFQEEILHVKDIIEENLHNLTERRLCQYYSTKVNMVNSFLNDEERLQSQGIQSLIDNNYFNENFSISKFQEELQIIMIQLKSLKGVEDIRELAELAKYSPTKTNKSYSLNTQEQSENRDIMKEEHFSYTNNQVYQEMNQGHHFENMNYGYFPQSATTAETNFHSPLDLLNKIEGKSQLSFRTRSANIFKTLDKILETRNKSYRKIKEITSPLSHKENSHEIDFTRNSVSAVLKEKDQNFANNRRNFFKEKLFVKTYNNIMPILPSPGSISTSEKSSTLRKSFLPESATAKMSNELDQFLLSPQIKRTGLLISQSDSKRDQIRREGTLKQKLQSLASAWPKPMNRSPSLKRTDNTQIYLRNSNSLTVLPRASRTTNQWHNLFKTQFLK